MGLKKMLYLAILALLQSAIAICDAAEVSEDVPTVWIGTTPLCLPLYLQNTCELLGMDYLREDTTGCWGGKRVQCGLKAPSSISPATPANEFRIATYNIFEVVFLGGNTGQRERTCRIPYRLLDALPSLDVIIFQEVFMGGCWPRNLGIDLRGLLQLHGFRHTTRNTGSSLSSRAIANGGIFIASRWPILSEEHHIFTDAHPDSDDRLAKKGVAYAKIAKTTAATGNTYHVFGTHMQAGRDGVQDKEAESGTFKYYREKQATEMAAFAQSMNIPRSETVFFGGDFNADNISDPNDVVAILDILNASLPQIEGEISGTSVNLWSGVLEGMWLDYIVTSNFYKSPLQATLQPVLLTAQQPFRVCRNTGVQLFHVWADTSSCSSTRTILQLSDHLPVFGTFIF